MVKFGYTIEELKETPASTFQVLLDEMTKEQKREEEANKQSTKTFSKR